MKLILILFRIGVLIASLLAIAYSQLPIGLKAVCITFIIAAYLNSKDGV